MSGDALPTIASNYVTHDQLKTEMGLMEARLKNEVSSSNAAQLIMLQSIVESSVGAAMTPVSEQLRRSAERYDQLEKRLSTNETHQAQIFGDLYGDPNKRSDHLSMFEQFARVEGMITQQSREINTRLDAQDGQLRRIANLEKGARMTIEVVRSTFGLRMLAALKGLLLAVLPLLATIGGTIWFYLSFLVSQYS